MNDPRNHSHIGIYETTVGRKMHFQNLTLADDKNEKASLIQFVG